MAKIISKNLVLRGVRVACDVETGMKRNGFHLAGCNHPAMHLSFSRHPSLSYPMAELDSQPWQEPAKCFGVANAMMRAGRLGCSSGVLVRRALAIAAGLAVQCGWPQAKAKPSQGRKPRVVWLPRVETPAVATRGTKN